MKVFVDLVMFFYFSPDPLFAVVGAVVFYMLAVSGARGQQVFDEQPRFTEVNPGSDVILTCRIYSKQGDCSWQKDNVVSLHKTIHYGFFT
jgi:hypothetical protein